MSNYKLVIENIQAISKAEIIFGEDTPITSIIGDNNLGKSTVNKILFALVKSSKDLREIDSEESTSNSMNNFGFGDRSAFNNIKRGTTFSTNLGQEIVPPILKYGENYGSIELIKDGVTIYKYITVEEENYDELTDTVTTGGIAFHEELNNLIEMDYQDVVYIQMNDILGFSSMWGDMLLNKNISNSTKDFIAKLMRSDNFIESEEDTLTYEKGRVIYKTITDGKARALDIRGVGDGFKRLSILNTLINNKCKKTLILLEEPEVGIHPNKIKVINDILIKASENNTVVFTSHSNLLISYLMRKSNIHSATNSNKDSNIMECATVIKYTEDKSEILDQYIEPLTELRLSKSNELLD